MKKTYKAPKYKTISLDGEILMQTSGSGDVTSVNRDYNSDDVTYVKAQGGRNLWDEEW